MREPTPLHRPSWAEIDLEKLSYNFNSVLDFIGRDIGCMAVVKANAYGHGAVECAKSFESDGAEWFGVALPEEGVELRKAGICKPILCLGSFWRGQENLLLEYDLTTVIYRTEQAEWLAVAATHIGKTVNIHIKVDTGMGRLGVQFDLLPEFIQRIKSLPQLNVEGVMTHFAVADDLLENAFTNEQVRKLNLAVDVVRESGFDPIYIDMANSPGAIAHPDSRGNMVRLGGILYGLGGDVLPGGIEKPELKPVMSLFTHIAHIKSVPAGTSLGYGRTFFTKHESLVATIPIGYHDGYPRLLSNKGRVLIKGRECPVVGRVSMDWTIVDISEVPGARVGDRAVLIGEDGERAILAEDLARETGTISYEITCGISSRVPRRYIEKS